MGTLFFILRGAMRSLFKMRITAAAVLLILAVGIAANLVVFSLVNATLLRPLPYSEAGRLLALDAEVNGKASGISWGEVEQMRRAAGLFESSAVYAKRTWALTDKSGNALEVSLSGMVSPEFFRVLGIAPVLGAGMESAGPDEHVVLLSYGLWQRRYRGDLDVLKQSLALNDVSYRIVGVLPKGFDFAIDGQAADLYLPLDRHDYCCLSSQRGLQAIARLADGVSRDAALEHLEAMARTAAAAEGLARLRYEAIPLKDYLAKDQRTTLLLLWLSVSALGLIAALNAGALLVARSLRKMRQYAVKLSLGATLMDLLREQIALATILSIGAGLLGLLLSGLILNGLRASDLFGPLLGNGGQNAGQLASLMDWRVVCFCCGLSFAAAFGACVLPLPLLRGLPIEQMLRGHAGITSSRRGRSLRKTLIVVQLGLSVMLLSAVSSFGHSLYAVLARDPGFKTRNIVMAGVGVPEARYDTDAKMIGFHEQVLASIRSIPDVRTAGFGAGVPVHPLKTGFLIDGTTVPKTQRPRVALGLVSAGMFEVLRLPMVRGRGFTETDRLGEPFVAIVNQAFARRYLDAADPLKRGMQVQFFNGVAMKAWSHFNVIGIVADSRGSGIDREPEPEIYLSTDQVALEGGSYFLDTDRPASALMDELPAAVWRVDRGIEKVEPQPMELWIADSFADKRVTLYLSLSFALTALLLAAVGLGSSVSAGVSEATKEIGIRSALGESRLSIGRRVIGNTLHWTLLATVCGAAGAVVFSRVIAVSMDGGARFDFWALPLVSVLMLGIAAAVSVLPIRHALRISPLEALRVE